MLRPMRFLPFAGWVPDLPTTSSGTIVDIKNAIPMSIDERTGATVYGPTLGPSRLTDTPVPDKPVGSIGFVKNDGTEVNIVGTEVDLYSLGVDGAWTSVVPASITLSSITAWNFELYGENIIAVAQDTAPLILKPTATQFALLGGSPPDAGAIATVGGFVVLASIEDHPMRVQWSGLDAAEIWGTSISDMSDFQDLHGNGGRVEALVPGERGLIFQERTIQRMEFTGSDIVFRIDNILPGAGTRAPRSVCWQGKDVFFYGLDGFYRMHIDNTEPLPIGAGKVDQWFLRNANTTRLREVVGAVDHHRELV